MKVLWGVIMVLSIYNIVNNTEQMKSNPDKSPNLGSYLGLSIANGILGILLPLIIFYISLNN
jgi:hypothetical protein